jgi:hypothetical protein
MADSSSNCCFNHAGLELHCRVPRERDDNIKP